MSLKTQAKVLRALDEQRFYPVGASQPVHVDVRVIAATNKNLEEEIARGNFREDLFYRLNVIPFFRAAAARPHRRRALAGAGVSAGVWPPVRQAPRRDDAGCLAVLKQYAWPGNVRELRNVIERVLILNPKAQRIERKHLPVLVSARRAEGGDAEEFGTLLQAREAYERDYILKKIDECHGNVSRAAEGLGLERSHLYRKMKALGVSVKD